LTLRDPRAPCVDDGRFAAHRDRFSQSADGEADVALDRATRRDAQILFLVRAEAGQLDGDLVDARRQIEELIFPLPVCRRGDGSARHHRRGGRYRRAGEDGLGRIPHHTEDSASSLRIRGARKYQPHDEEDRRSKFHRPPRFE